MALFFSLLRHHFVFILMLLFFILTPPFVFSNEEEILVSGDNSFHPFSFINDDGAPDGFDIDLIKAIAEISNIDIEIKLYPWATARRMIEEAEIDVLASMYYSESRDELVDFTIPHTLVYNSLYVRNDNDIMDYTDLPGRIVAVSEGYLISEYLTSMGVDFKLITAPSNEEALYMMLNGQCDAAIIERLQASILIKKNGIKNIRTIEANFPPQKNCIAVSEGNQELLFKLNEGLNILKQNGTFSELYQKWFRVLEHRTFFQRYKSYIIFIFSAAFMLLSIMLFWNRSLNRRVKLKTENLNNEIIQRKSAEQHLEKSLREKEVMLAELHHRVKNNLQIMISLIELQKEYYSDSLSEHLITSTQNRISTIALIHEHLYSSQNFTKINISIYIKDLTEYISGLYTRPEILFKIKFNVPAFYINYEKAIPLGLIISEIISNSMKYAFNSLENGVLLISAYTSEEQYILKLSDNGPGYDTKQTKKDSLGLKLMKILTIQLNGSLEKADTNGTSYVLKIPIIELIK